MSFLGKDTREKVLIIGNSPLVLEQKRGAEVNAFEGKIARCNHFKIEGFEEYVGTRTDVWVTGAINLQHKNMQREYDFVVRYTTMSDQACDLGDVILRSCRPQWNVYRILSRDRRELIEKSKIKWQPTTGIAGIYWLMTNNYKVYIYGFDFCISGRDYYTDRLHLSMEGHHDPVKEMAYAKKLIRRKKIFKF